MSKCHFPHDNQTVILDLPPLNPLSLRLIDTLPRLPNPSILSLSCLDPQPTRPLLHDHEEQDSLGLALESNAS